MERLSAAYGRLLDLLALMACLLLATMMLVTCADVLLRNVPLVPSVRGLEWANEASEAMLYLITMLAAPWLLRQGQHIRIDILLHAVPPRLAWAAEIAGDAIVFACCLALVIYGGKAAWASHAAGSSNIRALVTPEWWLLAPMPLAFALLAIEALFRLRRVVKGERRPRDDAVSAS